MSPKKAFSSTEKDLEVVNIGVSSLTSVVRCLAARVRSVCHPSSGQVAGKADLEQTVQRPQDPSRYGGTRPGLLLTKHDTSSPQILPDH